MPADEPLGRVFALFCLRRGSCFACGTTIAGSKTVDHVALGHGWWGCCLGFLLRAVLVGLPVALRRDGVSHVSILG